MDDRTAWQREIEELHDCFDAYFAGRIDSLDRVEAALAVDFTIVSPDGTEAGRDATMAALGAAHGRASELSITTSDHRLVLDSPDHLVARYVEHHEQAGAVTHRLSTVVFDRDAHAPNGWLWRTVHETWQP